MLLKSNFVEFIGFQVCEVRAESLLFHRYRR